MIERIASRYKVKLKSRHAIASKSLDHIHPCGTIADNSSNHKFNEKLYKLFPEREIKVLDIGCSGGKFVRDCLEDGYLAVGIEGSDISKRQKRAEWGRIPQFLFTCDATKDFTLYLNNPGRPLKFDVITAWEFFEHIEKKDISGVIKNIKKHISKDGLFIMSTTTRPSTIDGIDLHRTKETKRWWINEFARHGLKYRPEFVRYFNTQWIRGGAERSDDFHVIVGNYNGKPPKIGVLENVRDLKKGRSIKGAAGIIRDKLLYEK